jgi:hypothetical protein
MILNSKVEQCFKLIECRHWELVKPDFEFGSDVDFDYA